MFKENDVVSWNGWIGRVTRVSSILKFPLQVEFTPNDIRGRSVFYFTLDGRFKEEQTETSLTLIKRPNKTKKITGWVAAELNNRSKYYLAPSVVAVMSDIYETEEDCRARIGDDPNFIFQKIEIEVKDE